MEKKWNGNDRREWKEVPICGTVEHRGKVFKCVERGFVFFPCDACSGCDMSRDSDGRYFNCDPFRCSCFTRMDRTDVWFKLVRDGED